MPDDQPVEPGAENSLIERAEELTAHDLVHAGAANEALGGQVAVLLRNGGAAEFEGGLAGGQRRAT